LTETSSEGFPLRDSNNTAFAPFQRTHATAQQVGQIGLAIHPAAFDDYCVTIFIRMLQLLLSKNEK